MQVSSVREELQRILGSPGFDASARNRRFLEHIVEEALAQLGTSIHRILDGREGPAVIIAPFEDLTGIESGRLFAGGLTQELITNLTRFGDLRIYGVGSKERREQGLGQGLDLRYQVEGSVRRSQVANRNRSHRVVLDRLPAEFRAGGATNVDVEGLKLY